MSAGPVDDSLRSRRRAGVAMRPAGGDADLDALSAEADAAMYQDERAA